MTCRNARGGFTLIEVLVASLLLGMLVSILTMVFNQSAIAWRTGKAGVSQLSEFRREFSLAQFAADNILPRVDPSDSSKIGLVISAWDEAGDLRTRAVANYGSSTKAKIEMPSFSTSDEGGSPNCAPWAKFSGKGNIRSGSQSSFVVGVMSVGPDGEKDKEADNIASWREDVK